MNSRRLLERIRRYRNNVHFEDFIRLLEDAGFVDSHAHLKRNGSHIRYYTHPQAPGAQLPIQPDRNGEAKAYQLKQFLDIYDDYGLSLGDDD